MSQVSIPRSAFEGGWIDGREFTPAEAWLDLIQLADAAGVLPASGYPERWDWDKERVFEFLKKLEKHGHIRGYDDARWCIIFQVQNQTTEAEYEHLWRIYPRKVAKQAGYHAYCATRKGSGKRERPASARELYEATLKYAAARLTEDDKFIMNPETFFGTSERWKEKHVPRTNSKSKGKSQWSRPTSRDLTKTTGAQTKGRSPTKRATPEKKSTPRRRTTAPKKERKGKDPLGDL